MVRCGDLEAGLDLFVFWVDRVVGLDFLSAFLHFGVLKRGGERLEEV